MRDIPEERWRVEKVENGLGTVSAEFVVTKAIQKSRPWQRADEECVILGTGSSLA